MNIPRKLIPLTTHDYRISYHGGHSGDLCCHATGTKETVLKAYVKAGFTHVGVTEHVPPFPGEDIFLYADERDAGHTAESLHRRFAEFWQNDVPRLRDQFGQTIKLRFGFETEFYGDNPVDRMTRAIELFNPELIVLSVHHVGNMPIDYDRKSYDKAIGMFHGADGLWAAYYDHQFELIQFFI